jgi:hypothetical protein
MFALPVIFPLGFTKLSTERDEKYRKVKEETRDYGYY